MKTEMPLATTMQFRTAVKMALRNTNYYRSGYTDRVVGHEDRRYVKIMTFRTTEQQIKDIEFMLWCQGVTANTRAVESGIKGTCVIG